MARILTAGNEFGEYGADGMTYWAGSPTTSTNQYTYAQSNHGHHGNWAFYLTGGRGIQYDFTSLRPGGVDEFYMRFHMYLAARTDGYFERLRFTTGDGTVLLRFGTADGGSGATNGGYFVPGFFDNAGSVTPFVTGGALHNHHWHLFEMHVRFHPVNGEIRLWMNGGQSIQWNGSLTGPGSETQMYLLRLYYIQLSGGGYASTYYDNIAVNDTTGTINNARIGNGFILPMWPSGTGSSSQLTNAFGTSVDNFKFINKRPSWNPSGFVGTNTPGNKDLYEVPSLPKDFRGVNAIKLASYGVRNGPSITKAKFIVKPNAQAEIDLPSGVGNGITLPIGTPDYFWQDFESNPNNGGEPFSPDDIDGMEIGTQFIA